MEPLTVKLVDGFLEIDMTEGDQYGIWQRTIARMNILTAQKFANQILDLILLQKLKDKINNE